MPPLDPAWLHAGPYGVALLSVAVVLGGAVWLLTRKLTAMAGTGGGALPPPEQRLDQLRNGGPDRGSVAEITARVTELHADVRELRGVVDRLPCRHLPHCPQAEAAHGD